MLSNSIATVLTYFGVICLSFRDRVLRRTFSLRLARADLIALLCERGILCATLFLTLFFVLLTLCLASRKLFLGVISETRDSDFFTLLLIPRSGSSISVHSVSVLELIYPFPTFT